MTSSCNGSKNKWHVPDEGGSAQSHEMVRLNVGGELYMTTRATLMRYPDSMLGAMFSSTMMTAKDDSGCYFIDRDGPTFRHVLNFLRCGQLILPTDFVQLNLLAAEADFYRLEPLIDAITLLKQSNSRSNDRYLEIIEVRVGPTATMPTNNSRDKTVLSCRRDVINTLPAHFFSPTAERFQQKSAASGGGSGEVDEINFIELELVGSNVRLRLGEHLRRTGWTLCHSDMSSSSCGLDNRTSLSGNISVVIEHSFRDRWFLSASKWDSCNVEK